VDRVVDRVQLARTVLGAAATIALLLAYNVDRDRWEDAAWHSVANLIVAPFVLIIAGPLVILGFIYYAPPHLRPHLRSRLRAPLKAVGWYVLTLVAISGVLVLTALTVDEGDGKSWWEYVLAVAALIVIVWGFPFFFMASLYSARSAFNSAQVHPLLPPILTMSLVWVFAVFNVIGEGLPGGPPAVQFCSTLGGPLSVTAVALWELRRMRTRFGVTLRP
jgi:multisubunit Na+/H+ antiporter MnhB subunit